MIGFWNKYKILRQRDKLVQHINNENVEKDKLAYVVLEFKNKLCINFSEEEILLLSMLRDGKFIENKNLFNNYLLYSAYLIYLKLINEKTIMFFQTEEELYAFNELFSVIAKKMELKYVFADNELFNSNSKVYKKKFYSDNLILIDLNRFATDFLEQNYIENINQKVIPDNFFDRTVLIPDIKSITLFHNTRYSLVRENKETDFSLYFKALKLSKKIIKNEEMFNIEKNTVSLHEKGINFIEDELLIENIYNSRDSVLILNLVEDLLFVLKNFQKDIDYIVENKNIVLVNSVEDFEKTRLIKNRKNNLVLLLQLIEGLQMDSTVEEVETISNQILFSFFKKIQGISSIVTPYRDYILGKYNLDLFSLSKFKRDKKIKQITFIEEDVLVVSKENIFDLFYRDITKDNKIYISDDLNYCEVNEILSYFEDSEVIYLSNHKNPVSKSKYLFSADLNYAEFSFRYQNLIFKKMSIFNLLKNKLYEFEDLSSILEYLECEIKKLSSTDEDYTIINELIDSCLVKHNEISLKLLHNELFSLINKKREELYKEINLIISNFYYKMHSKEDPFSIFEKQVYFLLASILYDIFYSALVSIEGKCKNKKVNVIEVSF